MWRCPPPIADATNPGLSEQQEAERQASKAFEAAVWRLHERVMFAVEHASVKAAILGWGVVVVQSQGETRVGVHPLVRPGTVQWRADLDGRVDPATGFWFDGAG